MIKKLTLLLVLPCLCLAATYQVKSVEHTWKFETPGVLQQMTPVSGKWDVVTPPKINKPVLSQIVRYADFPKTLVKDKDFYDFEVATKLYISSENQETQSAGLILRYRNLYSFYMLFLNTKEKRITLTKAARGGLKVITRVNHEFSPDQWYELKAICYLDQIRAFVNGTQLLEGKDDTSTGGKVGLVTAGASKVYFENMILKTDHFEVIGKPAPPPVVPQSQPQTQPEMPQTQPQSQPQTQ